MAGNTAEKKGKKKKAKSRKTTEGNGPVRDPVAAARKRFLTSLAVLQTLREDYDARLAETLSPGGPTSPPAPPSPEAHMGHSRGDTSTVIALSPSSPRTGSGGSPRGAGRSSGRGSARAKRGRNTFASPLASDGHAAGTTAAVSPSRAAVDEFDTGPERARALTELRDTMDRLTALRTTIDEAEATCRARREKFVSLAVEALYGSRAGTQDADRKALARQHSRARAAHARDVAQRRAERELAAADIIDAAGAMTPVYSADSLDARDSALRATAKKTQKSARGWAEAHGGGGRGGGAAGGGGGGGSSPRGPAGSARGKSSRPQTSARAMSAYRDASRLMAAGRFEEALSARKEADMLQAEHERAERVRLVSVATSRVARERTRLGQAETAARQKEDTETRAMEARFAEEMRVLESRFTRDDVSWERQRAAIEAGTEIPSWSPAKKLGFTNTMGPAGIASAATAGSQPPRSPRGGARVAEMSPRAAAAVSGTMRSFRAGSPVGGVSPRMREKIGNASPVARHGSARAKKFSPSPRSRSRGGAARDSSHASPAGAYAPAGVSPVAWDESSISSVGSSVVVAGTARADAARVLFGDGSVGRDPAPSSPVAPTSPRPSPGNRSPRSSGNTHRSSRPASAKSSRRAGQGASLATSVGSPSRRSARALAPPSLSLGGSEGEVGSDARGPRSKSATRSSGEGKKKTKGKKKRGGGDAPGVHANSAIEPAAATVSGTPGPARPSSARATFSSATRTRVEDHTLTAKLASSPYSVERPKSAPSKRQQPASSPSKRRGAMHKPSWDGTTAIPSRPAVPIHVLHK